MEEPLSSIRFTPAHYQTISLICDRLELGTKHQAAFRRLLVEALREDDCPELANRLAGLGKLKLGILYRHFAQRPRRASNHDGVTFTTEEWQTLSEACQSAAFPVRFVRPFKSYLVEFFQHTRPNLARKVHWLSGHKFERLYFQALEEGRRLS